MAKKLSRKAKKAEKKRLQKYLQQNNVENRKVEKLSYSELNKEYNSILSENRKKENYKKQRNQRKSRISQKRMWLAENGFPEALETKNGKSLISDRKIDSIKQSDLQKEKVTRSKYDFLYGISSFDFDKIYTVKNGDRLFFAFQDWTGDAPSFNENIQTFSKYDAKTLLDFLDGAIHMPQTGHKVKGQYTGSSGKAATYKFQVASQSVLNAFQKETYNYNRRKSRRKKKDKQSHTLDYKAPFQVLKNDSRNSFDKVTARNLLIIANAIMYNVNEMDRVSFYKEFYPAINRVLPEIGKILPTP